MKEKLMLIAARSIMFSVNQTREPFYFSLVCSCPKEPYIMDHIFPQFPYRCLHPVSAPRPVIFERCGVKNLLPVRFFVCFPLFGGQGAKVGILLICFFLRIRKKAVVEDDMPRVKILQEHLIIRDLELDAGVILIPRPVTPSLTAQIWFFASACTKPIPDKRHLPAEGRSASSSDG